MTDQPHQSQQRSRPVRGPGTDRDVFSAAGFRLEERSDADLFSAYRDRGDDEALGVLFARHRRYLTVAAYSEIGDWHEADEIVSETIMVVMGAPGNFRSDGGATVRGWMSGIAAKTARSRWSRAYWRHQSSAEPVDLDALAAHVDPRHSGWTAPHAAPDAVSDDAEARAAREQAQDALAVEIAEALEALSPQRRRIMLRLYLEGYSDREVAADLGLALGTVKSAAHQARRRLRDRLAHLITD